MRFTWIVFACGLMFSPRLAAQSEHAVDEQTLAAAGLSSDGQSLLDFFRGRVRLDPDRERLMDLTRQLGDAAPDVRTRAADAR